MKAKKILSIFCIALILFLFGCTLFLAITNSPYFMGCLFLSFITPIIIYVFVWLYKLTHPAKDNHSKEETKQSETSMILITFILKFTLNQWGFIFYLQTKNAPVLSKEPWGIPET